MRFLSRSLVALFLAAVAVSLLAWGAQITLAALEERREREPGQPPARERTFAADVVAVEPGTVTPVLQVFGEVRAQRTLELRAPAGGRVVELAEGFVEGGRVEAGEVLLRLDPTDAEGAVALARADLAGAEAERRDAERALSLAGEELGGAEAQRDLQAGALRRQRDLAERGVGAAAAAEAAELALQAAEQTVLARRGAIAAAETRIDAAALAVERARIALAQAERDLADRTLRAEFAGVLSDVAVVRGGLVGANERLGALIDPTALEVAFRVSTAQRARLAGPGGAVAGVPVRAVLDVLGLELAAPGIVVREAPAVGEGRTGRQLFAALSDAGGFRPGDFVRVEVEEPALEHVARLPSAALSAQDAVLALGEGDRLEEVAVEVVRRQGDDVLVRPGPLRGREVVAARGPALGAGILVEPRREGAEEEPEEEQLLALDDDRRARLIAFVEGGRMPDEAKARLLARLREERVPARVVERIESRMGG
ncbi:efflux RND transporter periplasmic adaptor subunit [Jannaschia sp. W003]|uniref:efflux RND transporter periplasmic adaptor subunit n=1 Tax=Jannaschia sp. W003 TaxID=2867012 RepID=UPI0021A69067|nr:HlyD family efflux transporter periplasmic adaptor subunit [Jannaschia sp. W003]UWQ22708.1 HlyD family efflux transporter periplasmic adaptor subunit [Jannaschia sp. W003]